MPPEEDEDVIDTPVIEEDIPDDAANDDTPPEDEEVLTVQIGDEEPQEEEEPADGPDLVTKLRKLYREEKKARREAEAKIAAPVQQSVAEELGPEPQESDPGIDYDAKAYRDAWNAWDAKRQQLEARKETEREEQAKATERWQEKLEQLAEKKKALKVPDLEDAEDFVRETFNITQQGILIEGADDPALLGYALYKNPKKAKELAAITNPVEYAFAIAKTEASLKVGTNKTPPPPERGLSGRGGTNGAIDNTLEKLREKAAKTGDYSEVVAYKRKQAEKAKAA